MILFTNVGLGIHFSPDTIKNCNSCNNLIPSKKILWFKTSNKCEIVLGLKIPYITYGYCNSYDPNLEARMLLKQKNLEERMNNLRKEKTPEKPTPPENTTVNESFSVFATNTVVQGDTSDKSSILTTIIPNGNCHSDNHSSNNTACDSSDTHSNNYSDTTCCSDDTSSSCSCDCGCD